MSKPRPNTQRQIRQRREEVLILLTRGMKNKDIAKEMSVDPGTVTRDIQFLRKRSNDYVSEMAKTTMPFLFEKSLTGINEVLGECWRIYNRTDDCSLNWFHRLAALRLAKECSEEIYTLTKDGPFILGLKRAQRDLEKIKAKFLLDQQTNQKTTILANTTFS